MEKYLFITEKACMCDILKEIYLKNKDSIKYEADFVYVIASVSHIDDNLRKVDLTDNCWNKLVLKNIKNLDGYYIYNKFMTNKINHINQIISENNYDSIVNACDADLFGQLQYEFIKENINWSVPDKRMICYDASDSALLKSFQSLKNNNDILEKLLEKKNL